MTLREFCGLCNFTPTGPQAELLDWLDAAPGARGRGELDLPEAQPETLLLLGRGSGKTSLACLLGIHTALIEKGAEVVLAAPSLTTTFDVLVGRLRTLLEPLRPLIRDRSQLLKGGTTQRQVVMRNGSTLSAIPSMASAVRGRGPRVVVCDEVQSWPWSSAEGKDLRTFLDAVRPRQAIDYGDTRKVVLLGTPRIAAGPLFELWRSPPGEFCSVQLPTYTLRPDIPRERFEKEKRRDPRLYRIEIEAQWGQSEDGLINLERLGECMSADVPAPRGRVVLGIDFAPRRDYTGFCVASRRGELYYVHELRREQYKGDVERFIRRVKALKAEYRNSTILLDQFHGESLQELLRREGVSVQISPWTVANRSGAIDYLGTLVESRRIRLPESEDLRQECAGLVLKHTRTGVTRVEHQSSGHDDLLFSVLLAVEKLRKPAPRIEVWDDRPANTWHRVAL